MTLIPVLSLINILEGNSFVFNKHHGLNKYSGQTFFQNQGLNCPFLMFFTFSDCISLRIDKVSPIFLKSKKCPVPNKPVLRGKEFENNKNVLDCYSGH